MGASLYQDGKFNPSAQAKIGASVSAVQGEFNTSFGGDAFDGHIHGDGDLLAAKADASIGVSKEGVKAKAGAEAYVAKGKISGGVKIFGIKIDVGLEGGAGGAGAKLGGEVTTNGVKGELGAGLGLGAGMSVSIDWSGFAKGVDSTINGIRNWFGKRE